MLSTSRVFGISLSICHVRGEFKGVKMPDGGWPPGIEIYSFVQLKTDLDSIPFISK